MHAYVSTFMNPGNVLLVAHCLSSRCVINHGKLSLWTINVTSSMSRANMFTNTYHTHIENGSLIPFPTTAKWNLYGPRYLWGSGRRARRKNLQRQRPRPSPAPTARPPTTACARHGGPRSRAGVPTCCSLGGFLLGPRCILEPFTSAAGHRE